MIPVKAKAGYALGYSDPEFIKELPTIRLPFLSKNRKYRTFPISGDSMPPVSDGSFVVGEFVQDWTSIKSDTPCIFVTKDEGIVFKIIENQISVDKRFYFHRQIRYMIRCRPEGYIRNLDIQMLYFHGTS